MSAMGFPPRRVTRAAASLAVVIGMVAASTGQTANTIEGGFRLFDPKDPRGREVGVLSLGPLVVAGARARTSTSPGEAGLCTQMILVMLGAEGTRRRADSVRLKQSDNLVVFFVFAQCTGEDATCLAGASEAPAVSGCSGKVKLLARDGISGKVIVKCKNGIAASDPSFGLTAVEQGWAADAFPGIGERFVMTFKEQAGERISDESLAFKIRNFDVDALDDVVGTYLADDELPLCPG
jgi:hypothetical protein